SAPFARCPGSRRRGATAPPSCCLPARRAAASRASAEKLHGFCLKYRGATALLLRKARVSITNSTAELLVRAIIAGDPRVRHVPSKSRFEYAKGSLLIYAGMDDEQQRERLR